MKGKKKFFKHFFFNTGIIFVFSLIWFLLRTGTKPTRAIYPCQRVARRNIELFGIPIAIFFFHKLRHNPRFRKNIFLGIFVVVFSFIFVKTVFLEYKKGLTKKAVAQSVSSRVVWVTKDGAALGYTNRQYEQKADQALVNGMMDNAVKGLTGKATIAEAWTQIFKNHNNGLDYVSGEKIAIKINNNDGCDNLNERCPMIQTVRALLRQLINEKGILQTNITVYDTTRGIVGYQSIGIHRDFPGVLIGGQNNCSGIFGQDLIDAKYLINMPLFSTHSMAGVTASFKNNLGSMCHPENYHGCNSECVNNPAIVQLNCSDLAGGKTPFQKTLLVVADAIYGIKMVGPYGNPQGEWGITNPYPNSIFMSQDPVAVDSVMIDYIQSRVGDPVSGTDPRDLIQRAAATCGGNYATSCTSSGCTFNYSKIDLVRCDNANCPTVPVLTLTPTPTSVAATPTPSCGALGDVDCSGQVNVFDLAKLILKFGQIFSGREDVDGSGKINSLDLGTLFKNYGN